MRTRGDLRGVADRRRPRDRQSVMKKPHPPGRGDGPGRGRGRPAGIRTGTGRRSRGHADPTPELDHCRSADGSRPIILGLWPGPEGLNEQGPNAWSWPPPTTWTTEPCRAWPCTPDPLALGTPGPPPYLRPVRDTALRRGGRRPPRHRRQPPVRNDGHAAHGGVFAPSPPRSRTSWVSPLSRCPRKSQKPWAS